MRLRLNGTFDDYRKKVLMGLAQVHNFDKGCAVTEVVSYTNPEERILNVLLLGGEQFEEWKAEADRVLVSFARVNGCNAIEFACRLGLERKVTELGYRKFRVLMRKDIDEQASLESGRVSS